MTRTWSGGAVAALAALLALPAAASAADGVYVGGTVADATGAPVAGVELELVDASGKLAGKATTGDNGGYALPCVPTGRYTLRLDPASSGVKGDTVAAPVGADGLIVNWTVDGKAPALAAALAGGGPCAEQQIGAAPPAPAAGASIPPAAIVGGAGAVVVGGTLGGLAASGAFDGSDRSSATPSQ
ncbi:MAG: carboxypeptidase-like regulatory domain-containing protein [Thermodesulfobacteriota bacterium]